MQFIVTLYILSSLIFVLCEASIYCIVIIIDDASYIECKFTMILDITTNLYI